MNNLLIFQVYRVSIIRDNEDIPAQNILLHQHVTYENIFDDMHRK